MRIIINADDFGYTENVNRAIAECFSKGYITNTTLMTNMKGCTEDAVKIAKEQGFFDRVGLHLNIYEGEALTDPIKSDFIFSENRKLSGVKILHKVKKIYKFFLPNKTKEAIKKECAAQMKLYGEMGFTLNHLDSHGHSHTIYSVFKIIKKLNKNYNFKTCRLTLNMMSEKRKLPVRLYKKLFNSVLKNSFKSTDYFTSAAEFIDIAKKMNKEGKNICSDSRYKDRTCEIMVHPKYDEDGKLINKGGPGFNELMPYLKGAQLISFKDLV